MSVKDHKQSSSHSSSFQQDVEDLEEALKELRTLSRALLDVETEELGVDGDHQLIENESDKPGAPRTSSSNELVETQRKGTAKKGASSCKEAKGKQKAVHTNGKGEKQKQSETTKRGTTVARSSSSSMNEDAVTNTTESVSINSSSNGAADRDLGLSFGMPAQSVLFVTLYCITLLCLQNADITIVSASSAHVEHEKRVRLTVCPSSLLNMPLAATQVGSHNESAAASARRAPSVLVLDAAASRENLINAATLAPEYFGSLFVHYLSLLKTGRSFFSGHVQDGRGHGHSVTTLIVSCPFLEPLIVSIVVALIVCVTRFVAIFMDAAYADARRGALHKKQKTSSNVGTKSHQQKVSLSTEVQPRILSVNFVIANVARLLASVPIMALQHALLVVFVVGIANNIAIMLDLTDRMLIMC